MKSTWNRLATTACLLATSFTLHAGTYFVESLGGTGGPPYPFDPTHGTAPMTETGPDQYYVEDGDPEFLEGGGMMMSMGVPDPGDTNNVNTNGYSYTPLPNIRNYAKYSQQVFYLLDTNSLVNTDTNLYNACAAMAVDTNTTPILQIQPYGQNAVIIKASHFDYSAETTRDFALIVCDKVETPTWKTIDFAGASDAQDGWLVQGTVPNWKVSDAMFMLVQNINTTYPAFFRAIPYGGPQVVINGQPLPYDTVSNIITLNAQIQDLSGVTNEQFEVDVDGDLARYGLTATNTVNLDTEYNINNACNVYLNVSSTPTVNNLTNAPGETKLFFSGAASIPLTFQNDTYLAFQSDNASSEIGTNYFYFSINKEQDIAGIISDPSDGHVVLAFTNHVPYAATVYFGWNFTEADGVTPYTNDTYAVRFIAFDPANISFTNNIPNTGVRVAAGNMITYEQEDPSLSGGPYLNSEANTYVDQDMTQLYTSLYDTDPFSPTEFAEYQIGPNRDNPEFVFPFVLYGGNEATWGTEVLLSLTNPIYSDFTYYMGHCNGTQLGGGPPGTNWVNSYMESQTVEDWAVQCDNHHKWRMRKVALWGCYSDSPSSSTAQGTVASWQVAFGIRNTSVQRSSYCGKNVGLFFGGELPQTGYSGAYGHTSVEVAAEFDELWMGGPFFFPGGCDPSYSFGWATTQMEGMNPEVMKGLPTWIGFGFLPYTGVLDDQLLTNNITGIHNH